MKKTTLSKAVKTNLACTELLSHLYFCLKTCHGYWAGRPGACNNTAAFTFCCLKPNNCFFTEIHRFWQKTCFLYYLNC
jgi:hypothetical protein